MKSLMPAVRLMAVLAALLFSGSNPPRSQTTASGGKHQSMTTAKLDTATLAAGCFWCVEGVYQNLKGVRSVVSGYSGGTIANPPYEDVTSRTTGHAETCQITYDPKQVSFAEILEVFWKSHDP